MFAILMSCIAAALLAQEPAVPKADVPNPAANNPHLSNKESIRSGMALYRLRCADCHGLDATGYRGPDLTAALARGMSDERLFQTIRKGVPGTEMPASGGSDDEVLMTIAYLRNLTSANASEPVVGNVDNGRKIFAAQCVGCHRVDGRGGRIGPDLTRIGISRSRAALVREIRTPSDWMAPEYATVTLVTKGGQRIRGVKKNEDTFSIQIMDVRERIQGYLKSDLQQVIYDKDSLMPAFDESRLSESDLRDLVGYLSSLRGPDISSK